MSLAGPRGGARGSATSALDKTTLPGVAQVRAYGAALDAIVLTPDSPPFKPVPKPSRDDWLANFRELGQSFASYAAQSSYNVAAPHGSFDTLLIVVFGADLFSDAVLQSIRDYVAAFYAPLKVVLLRRSVASLGDEVRVCNGTRGVGHAPQVVAEDLMRLAQAAKNSSASLSRRVIATMGLTALDIAKDVSGDFWMYGVARAADSCGVFSLARFHPVCSGGDGINDDADVDAIILRRACKVATHEFGHLFGLRHCVNHLCLMNGSNHVGELNRQPLLECPACTKKLTLGLGWSLPQRWAALADVCGVLGFANEASLLRTALLPLVSHCVAPPVVVQSDTATATARRGRSISLPPVAAAAGARGTRLKLIS